MGVGVEILRLKLEDPKPFTHYRSGNWIKKFESTPGFTGPHSSHTFFPHFTTLKQVFPPLFLEEIKSEIRIFGKENVRSVLLLLLLEFSL